MLLRRDGIPQLVYKHAISTVMPGAPIQLFDAASSGQQAPERPLRETTMTLQREPQPVGSSD